jgi:hypothetical protein
MIMGPLPYHDPLNQYDNHDEVYTLKTYVPARVPGTFRKWLHNNMNPAVRTGYDPAVDYRNGENQECQPLREKPQEALMPQDLPNMKFKTVKLMAYEFPLDFRCLHVQTGSDRSCNKGCYLLERGGDGHPWKCKSQKCEGHRWNGGRKMSDKGAWCFGHKGKRLVLLEDCGEWMFEN